MGFEPKAKKITIPKPALPNTSTEFVFRNSPSDSFFSPDIQNLCMEKMRLNHNVFLNRE